jgi:hypothetical protein
VVPEEVVVEAEEEVGELAGRPLSALRFAALEKGRLGATLPCSCSHSRGKPLRA